MLDKTMFERVPLDVVLRIATAEIKRAGKKKELRQAISGAKLPPMENSSHEKKGKP